MTKGSISILAASMLGMTVLIAGCGAGGVSGTSTSTQASTKSGVITVGTLYAQSGAYATSSMPEYEGLKFWAHEMNADGGVYVKAAGKKEKVKIVAYNDESSTETATTEYSQLITQNHVNMLVADFGSVLTSVAVPIAEENKMLLFDQSGSGTTFFDSTPPNKYIVLTSIQSSGFWPDSLSKYIIENHINKVAIVYAANDFTGSQNQTLTTNLKAAGITPVYDHPVPTSTSNYSDLLNSIAATKPDMVIELGYDTNDIAFLQAVNASQYKFAKVFTIFPGQEESLFVKDVGVADLDNTYTYPAPPLTKVSGVNYGMSVAQFTPAFEAYSGSSGVNFEDIAGYNTGLILQKTLATSTSLKQLAFRKAVNTFSGKVTTIEGTFRINPQSGAQEGLPFPVGQWKVVNGNLKLDVFENTIQGEE